MDYESATRDDDESILSRINPKSKEIFYRKRRTQSVFSDELSSTITNYSDEDKASLLSFDSVSLNQQ